jgi:hypothetical protein
MIYICKICGRTYNTYNAVRSHLRHKHGWSFEQGDAREYIQRVVVKRT